jgi:regulator of protease activity HflC (stomatin/prohibitin superfamily)
MDFETYSELKATLAGGFGNIVVTFGGRTASDLEQLDFIASVEGDLDEFKRLEIKALQDELAKADADAKAKLKAEADAEKARLKAEADKAKAEADAKAKAEADAKAQA